MPTGQYGSLAGGVEQPAFFQQDPGLQEIGDGATHRDDVVGHRGWTVNRDSTCGSGDDREFFSGQFRQLLAVADQRPSGAQLVGQDVDPFVFAQRAVVGMHAGPGEQLGDHLFVDVGVLPHVQAGQVKTEDVHGFSQSGQPVIGQ